MVRLAPLSMRLTGESAVTSALTGGSDEKSQASHLISHNLTGLAITSGYVWRPWFSSLNLQGSVQATQQSSSGTSRAESSESFALRSSGRLTFFPTSWFPTTASLDVGARFNDSVRRDAAFGLRHRYQGRAGTWEPDVDADYRIAWSEGPEEQTRSERFSLVANDTYAGHEVTTEFQWQEDWENGESEGESYVLTGEHDYQASAFASYSDFASYVRLEDAGSETDIMQYSNSYRFDLTNGWSLISSLRLAETDQSLEAGDGQSFSSMALSGGANKQFGSNLRLSVTGSYTTQQADGDTSESYSAGSALNYTWGGLYLAGWDGRANASAGVNFRKLDDSQEEGANFSLGHGWRRALPHGDDIDLRELRFSQTISTAFARGSETVEDQGEVPLTQSLDYSIDGPALGRIFVGLSDRRVLNGGDSENQRLQAVYNKDFWRSPGGQLSGDWTGFVSRVDEGGRETVDAGAAGILRFTRSNLFRIPRLTYYANATMTFNVPISGEGDGEQSRDYTLEHGASWMFGRLSARGRMYYEHTETGGESRNSYGVSMTITRRWDSL